MRIPAYFLLSFLASSVPGFIEVPTDLNVTQSSIAQFVCTVSHGPLFWLVDGNETWQKRGITVTFTQLSGSGETSILSVPASERNNNSVIECGAFVPNKGQTLSKQVHLKVQGLLAPPPKLKVVSVTSTTIHLTWVQPFSLDITGIEPDISNYVVYIRNTNTGNITTASLSETEYTFMRQDFGYCDTFEFSVLAMNDAGEGSRTDPVAASFLGPPVLSTFPNGSGIPIGEWASLSCTAPCTDAVLWYTKNNPHPLRYSLPGLKIRKTVLQLSDCSSRKDNYTEMLEVFATAQSNATELQCVSIPVCTNTDVQCRPQVCYSDFAQLLVYTNELEPSPVSAIPTSHTVSFPSMHPCSTTKGQGDSRDMPSRVQTDTTLAFLIGGVGVLTTITAGILGATLAVLITRHCTKTAAITEAMESASASIKEEAIYEQPFPPPPQPTQMHPCPAYGETSMAQLKL